MSRARTLWALLVLGVAGFVALALAYDHEPLASLDTEVSEWVFTELPEWAEWLARPFSWLGGWIGLTLLGVGAGALLGAGAGDSGLAALTNSQAFRLDYLAPAMSEDSAGFVAGGSF